MALKFIGIPTEQTTAVTDLILAMQTMICLRGDSNSFVRSTTTVFSI
jgi:hypothetical protein